MNITLLSAIRQSGFKQWELAQKAGITESSLSRLLNDRPISERHATRLKSAVAVALNRDISELFGAPGVRHGT